MSFKYNPSLDLLITNKGNPYLHNLMEQHYSHPKGFVARSICYAIFYNQHFYGYITGGSATKHLPNRNEYFGINTSQLNSIVNNTFFHIERVDHKYPTRNFIPSILATFRHSISTDWFNKYGDKVIGFETLIELPLTGYSYLRDGWTIIGQTKGYTCKRIGGKGTDSWGGKRVWNKDVLKPKLVLVHKND